MLIKLAKKELKKINKNNNNNQQDVVMDFLETSSVTSLSVEKKPELVGLI